MSGTTRCALLPVLVLAAANWVCAVEVGTLTCEYLDNPLGIDVVEPRLSWMLQSAERGERQTAYHVLVADSPARLAADQGNLWDSGKVASDQSVHVVYAGRPLKSRDRCWWKVRVWDSKGQPSPWSKPATWEIGLLDASDWQAQWIGRDEPESASKNVLTGTNWIWRPDVNPQSPPPGLCYFRRTIELPAGRVVRRAVFYLTGDNAWTLLVNGKQAATGGDFHQAPPVDVRSQLQPGANTIAVSVNNLGDTPNPAGLIGLLRVEFAEGAAMVVATDASWRSSATAPSGWEKPGFDDSAWKNAQVLGAAGIAPWGDVNIAEEDRHLPARMLRKEFQAAKKIRQARAYLCGLGYYELYVNGSRIGNRVLDPALSEYDKRIFYVAYDITKETVPGANAVGVMLGNSRFFAPRQRYPAPARTFGFPKLLLQIEIRFDDGSIERVVSDLSWKLTTEGPIRANNDYDGEEYDARREMSGWSKPGFDDSRWPSAQAVKAPEGRLAAQKIPPMRVTETLQPVKLSNPQPGVYVYDMGQNLVGWCRLSVRGPAATRVELRHAETLGPDGMLYVANLRSAQCKDTYVLKGEGPEVYEPRFTYHGFRYVELRGYPGVPDLTTLQGRVVHTDLKPAGAFQCSNDVVNRVYRNIVWGVRGNYLSIPTDCPQRDERQGWQGDRAAESKGESFLYEVVPLYAKWMDDIRDGQKPNGALSDVSPTYWQLYSDNVTWPSAYIIIPGTLYRQYGDRRVLAQHFDGQKKWLDQMCSFLKEGITDRDTYGDWCVPPEDPKLIHSNDPARKTPGNLLATAYLCHNLRLVAGYAKVLGKSSDAEQLERRAAEIAAAFNRRFYDEKARCYGNGSQTSQVLSLAFGLAGEAQGKAAFASLVENIEKKCNGHIGTGLIGGQWLLQTLTRGGRADLAWRIATNRDYPSWGYMADHGATTVWELWNGDTADPAMNSHNHVMLVGDLTTWLYEDVAGIRTDPQHPGFKRLVMHPQTVPGLDFCKASYRTMYGTVVSEWERHARGFRWRIRLPAQTAATIAVPASDAAKVREGAGPAASSPGVRFIKAESGRVLYEIGAGSYEFVGEP